MLSNRKGTHPQIFWSRFIFAVGLMVAFAAAYGAKQSAEQTNAPASDVEQSPSLNGTWKLNRDQSDDPQEKLRSAMQDRDQNGPMGGHVGMGGGGVTMGIPGIGGIGGGGMGRRGGGPGMGGGSGAGSQEQRAKLRDLVEAPDQLTVTQKGTEIDMADTQSHVRSLFTDGRKLEKPKKDNPQTQVKAHWEHETLVTEEKGSSGEKISHSYEIAGEGKQLADTLTVESKKLNTPIIVRSVYERARAE